MEAIANEKMLKRIPSGYFRNEEIKTALSVVFEDRTNAASNKGIYEKYLTYAEAVIHECF
jgi:hypothetical protein